MKTAIAQISQISPKKELLQNRLVITGLEGKKPLAGTIRISGAKNAALKAMAAAVLFDGPVTLENVPDTADIHTLAEILIRLGAKVAFEKDHTFTVTIDPTTIAGTAIDAESAKTMRGSVVLTGPLLARFGRATFPAPGGCVIGARPIDLFLEGYKKMGAAVSENGQYDIEAASGLAGAEISFEKISVGATETLMMAAVLARGTTTLKNCAMEPEIVNVAEWLNSCGADIRGAGTPTITIVGTAGKLLKPSASYVTIPDRIEAGSYLFLGALCASELVIENCRPDHLQAPIELLKKAGVPIETTADSIRIVGNDGPNTSFKAFDLKTKEYPGFATDLQAQAVVFLTQASGKSDVYESIFEGRFKYVADLARMGAAIEQTSQREVRIEGPADIHALPEGEQLNAHDIRAGFAMVMAALVATGRTALSNIHLIDRGYESIEAKLSALGAKIERVNN